MSHSLYAIASEQSTCTANKGAYITGTVVSAPKFASASTTIRSGEDLSADEFAGALALGEQLGGQRRHQQPKSSRATLALGRFLPVRKEMPC